MKNILLLVGSPRKENSTSNAIGEYLLEQFNKSDFNTQKKFLYYTKQEKTIGILDAIEWSDLIILSFPLYVDSLPAYVVKNLEIIKAKYNCGHGKYFFAISNCGFPESYQNRTALDICQQFSKEMNWEWRGSLAVGMGAAINGNKLDKKKNMVKNIVKELDRTYINLVQTENSIAVDVEPSIPHWLYIMMGNMGWRFQAFKNGVLSKLNNMPLKG